MMININDLYDAAQRAGMLTPVRVGAVTVGCAFRAPDDTVLDGLALTREYEIEYPAERLQLGVGSIVEIGGQSYRVREVKAVRDGSEYRAKLEKL